MQNNISRVLTLINCCSVSHNSLSLHSFIQRCERDVVNCLHIKKSRLKHDQITNDLFPDLVIVLRRINFKPFQVWRNTGAGIAVVLGLSQTQITVVEIVVVHFVQLFFFNSLQRKSIQCLQIHLNQSSLHSSSLLQCQECLNHLNSL